MKVLSPEGPVDASPLPERIEPSVRDRERALEAFHRNRAWLGREFLTWLLFRSEPGEPLASWEGEGVVVIFVGAVLLKGLSGDATELRAKGHQSAYADVVKEALRRGLLVHEARLRLLHGEQVYEVTLDAEALGLRSAAIPKVLSEEGDDRLLERLFLIDRLAALVDVLWNAFVTVRQEPAWDAREVPALRSWLAGRT